MSLELIRLRWGLNLMGVTMLLGSLMGSGNPAIAQDDPGPGLGSEEEITITKHAVTSIPILLEDLGTKTGATSEDTEAVYQVLANDLTYTGFFSMVKIPRTGPEDTIPPGKALALVRGTVSVSRGELILHGVLESLPGRGRIFARDYRTRPEWFREAAHRFADDIVEHLTEYQGIARTKIAFVSDRSGNKEIYIVDYDGEGVRQVTRNGSINLSPTWSPDSKHLAYVSYKNGDADIFLIDMESGKDRLLVGGQGVQAGPTFSPDGKSIIFSQTAKGESEIYIVSVNGGRKRRLTRLGGINTSPTFSPDGRHIAFTSDRTGTPQIYISDVEGGSPRRITFAGKWNDIPDWSPSGDRIAFASRQDGQFRLGVVDPSGFGEEKQKTYGPGSDEHPSWAPDSRHLVYSSTRGRARGLYVFDVDSGLTRTLTRGAGNCSAGTWSPVPGR